MGGTAFWKQKTWPQKVGLVITRWPRRLSSCGCIRGTVCRCQVAGLGEREDVSADLEDLMFRHANQLQDTETCYPNYPTKTGWVSCLLDLRDYGDQSNLTSYPCWVYGQWLFTLLMTDLDILIMVLESTDSQTFEAYIQPASNCCVSEVPEVLLQKQPTLKKFGCCSLKSQNRSAPCENTNTLFPIFTVKIDPNDEHFTVCIYQSLLNIFSWVSPHVISSLTLFLYTCFCLLSSDQCTC